MLALLLLLLIILWFFGYIHITGLSLPDIYLFTINDHQVTLIELLIFVLLLGVITELGTPLREVAFIVIVLWLLSTLGIIAITGLSSLLVIAVILGLILALLGLI